MVRGRRTGDRRMVTAPRQIPDAVRATQARASDPKSSAFVSANAGSGKTHVLVQRVIRLLLSGRSEEHTSELQSLRHLVCRLLLEKKKKAQIVSQEQVHKSSN